MTNKSDYIDLWRAGVYLFGFLSVYFYLQTYNAPSKLIDQQLYDLKDAYVFEDACQETVVSYTASSTNKLTDDDISNLCDKLNDLSKKESKAVIKNIPVDDKPEKESGFIR